MALDAAQARGKSIYTQGVSRRGSTPKASFLDDHQVAATQLPCIQCHGSSGLGGYEAGVMVPDIRRTRLFAPYGVPGSFRRTRPPYDAITLARAIRRGIDSAGNPLDNVMPRYELTDEDLGDLLAYLEVLGHEPVPGLDDESIRIGALLPLDGGPTRGGQSRAVEALLTRYFAGVNRRGGINGRRIDFSAIDTGPDRASALVVTRRLVDTDAFFCGIACAGPGACPEVLDLLDDKDIPVIGPLVAPDDDEHRWSTFHVLPSVEDQARAAARQIAWDHQGRARKAVTVVAARTDDAQRMASAFVEEAEEVGLPVNAFTFDHPDRIESIVGAAAASGAFVLLLSSEDVLPFVLRLPPDRSRPTVVLTQVLLGGPAPVQARPFLLVTPPVAPGADSERSTAFVELWRDTVADDPAEHARHVAVAMTAFAAAVILEQGLVNVGRDLDRQSLEHAIADLTHFPTGVMPPITYTPGRRQGVKAALIAMIDDSGDVIDAGLVDVQGPANLKERIREGNQRDDRKPQ